MAALNVTAVAASFAASYLGLYQWAYGHGLAGWRALAFPLAIDTFLAMGELALFVAVVDGFDDTVVTAVGAACTAVGLAASVAGNAAHAPDASLATRATWAAFPIAAAASLAVGLLVLRRIMVKHRADVSAPVSTKPPWAATPVRQIMAEEKARGRGVSSKTAQTIQRREAAVAKAMQNGHGSA
jgi:hypothetical protein